MTTAFQQNAFQNNAFQIDGTAPAVGSISGKRRYHRPSELEKELEEQRPFSRQLFDDLKAAQAEAERKAGELKASKRKRVLAEAAKQAAQAIEVVRNDERDEGLEQLTPALEAAAGATQAAETIRQSRIAIAAAKAIMAELEDEEEAEMLLLQ